MHNPNSLGMNSHALEKTDPGAEVFHSRLIVITPRIVIVCLFYALVACALSSLFMTTLSFCDEGLAVTFILTQCIGLSACLCFLITFSLYKPRNRFIQILMVVITMILGAVLGSLLGAVLTAGKNPFEFLRRQKDLISLYIFYSGMIGSIAIYLYFFRERIFAAEALIQEERIKRLSTEKKVAESNLRVLQAQVEPHFLFNTLSGILSLLETDPEKGKTMLLNFMQYLRASLDKTRDRTSTIEQEIEIIRAYLEIFKVRMGDRLGYRIDVPDRIRHLPFPSMIIQPVVENAIKHGLESKIEGGWIDISFRTKGNLLRVEIADTGLGFDEKTELGFGLSNIKERIDSLYGGEGQIVLELILEQGLPAGLKVILEVPHA